MCCFWAWGWCNFIIGETYNVLQLSTLRKTSFFLLYIWEGNTCISFGNTKMEAILVGQTIHHQDWLKRHGYTNSWDIILKWSIKRVERMLWLTHYLEVMNNRQVLYLLFLSCYHGGLRWLKKRLLLNQYYKLYEKINPIRGNSGAMKTE